MDYFVKKDSIVRTIWGKGDTILFIFAGASAEFALNKAVDWLYFTGKLPADPIGRLFSTVSYARQIVFLPTEDANKAIDRITAIHGAVEESRGAKIPDWAYRDVLYMLIHYSVAAFEVLERPLSPKEKEEVFDVFCRVGSRMHLKDLPVNYEAWRTDYTTHLETDLAKTDFTLDLFKQYKKHLGNSRYFLLLETQKLVVPERVTTLLDFGSISFTAIILPLYKLIRMAGFHTTVRALLLPKAYREKIADLDRQDYQL
jgi:hypothetical protein